MSLTSKLKVILADIALNLPRAFARSRDGAVAVEFAIISLPFIAVLFATVQTAVVFFAAQTLESVVEESSRLLLTGQAQSTGMTQTQFQTAVCANVPALFTCSGLMIDVQTASSFTSANTGTPTLTFNGSGQVTNTWQYQPGNPGDIVVVRVMYQWPVLLGPMNFTLANLSNGNRLLMATAVFKNEQYQ